MLLIQDEINEIEKFLGFPIKRSEITIESEEPHDEKFSYGLCQRFYRKEDELKIAIDKTTKILSNLIKSSNKEKNEQISIFFSLLGNMHYILNDFNRAAGCFMKSLSYNKNDLTSWVEFIFSLRSMGNFEVFEDMIFNLEKIHHTWEADPDSNLTKGKIYELIDKVKK